MVRNRCGYVPAKREVFVDRSRSGNTGFHANFPGRHAAQVLPLHGRIKLNVWVDTCSVEVFAGEGAAVITDLVFPEEGQSGVVVYAVQGTVKLV
ncbi:GH32 C-terminal domain-containing protein [Paenibacillus puerhi]|uniref:GH32 C-terminal domain-containing protein n=1 Tax=Paenibacillus puerhi TaxID=2692622 RepID=UPI001F2842BA|nr:GH32 C-terminal domain-containing protein [Paenibacillus puerhi]